MPHALIVDDDPTSRSALADLIARDGYTTALAGSLAEARSQFEPVPDLVLVDLVLPDGSGMELLSDPTIARRSDIVLITGHGSVESSVSAMRLGAFDYLTKPLDTQKLQGLLTRVGQPGVAPERPCFGPLIGGSPPMLKLYGSIARIAPTDATVLIIGESRHRQGARRADAARALAARQRPLPRRQLRRGIAEPDRKRAVRPREGRVHRGDAPAQRLLRARERRHAVPRRGHRDAARPAGAPAARARDARGEPRRLDRDHPHRRAGDRRHQPRSLPGGEGGQAAGGPAVPPAGGAAARAAAARAQGRHRAADASLPEAAQRQGRHEQGVQPVGAGAHGALRLAGQRARAVQRRAARVDPVRGQVHHPAHPAARDGARQRHARDGVHGHHRRIAGGGRAAADPAHGAALPHARGGRAHPQDQHQDAVQQAARLRGGRALARRPRERLSPSPSPGSTMPSSPPSWNTRDVDKSMQ